MLSFTNQTKIIARYLWQRNLTDEIKLYTVLSGFSSNAWEVPKNFVIMCSISKAIL